MLSHTRSFLSLLLILFSTIETIGSPNISGKQILQVKTSYFLNDKIPQGKSAEFIIKLQLKKDFIAYKDKFELKILEPSSSQSLSNVTIKPSFYWSDKYTKKRKEGVKNQFQIMASFKPPTTSTFDEKQLLVQIKYQACNKEICLFPQSLTTSLNYQTISSEKISSLIATKSSYLETELKKVIGTSFFLALLLCFLAGILTSFTPCVLPMIPITLAVLGTKKDNISHWRKFLLSSTYVLGIATTYSLFGIVAAQTGSLFGAALQNPYVTTAAAIIFIAMGLSMYGIFEVKVPAFITNKLGQHKTKKNYWGAYLTGLVSGLLASPCVGPVLIVILTYVAQQQNVIYGGALLFAYALGIGQIFLLLGTFSQFITALPKSGPWLKVIRFTFGTTMIFMAFYFLKPFFPALIPIPKSSYKNVQLVSWQKYSLEKITALRKSGRPIVIDFYAEWCLVCKEIENEVINSPEIQAYHKDIIWVQFNATKESPEFLKLKEKYGIIGLPHIVFYDKNGHYLKELTLRSYEPVPVFKKKLQKILGIKPSP